MARRRFAIELFDDDSVYGVGTAAPPPPAPSTVFGSSVAARGDPADIIRVPGRLVLNPTDLSAAFPHGGTVLCVTRDQELRPVAKYHREEAEEWGGAPARILFCGEAAIFAAVLRSWDSVALAHAFPATAAGNATGGYGIVPDVDSDSLRAGRFLSGSVILFSPVALDTHPAALLYNAVPMLDEAAKLQLSLKVELAPAVMWACLPDANGRTYAVRNIGDLSL